MHPKSPSKIDRVIGDAQLNCELKMDTKISIYLAGSIKKGHQEANESFWTDEDMLFLKKNLPEEEGVTWIRKFVSASAPQAKDIDYIQSAMQYSRDSQLSHDEPMKTLIIANQKLHKRVWGLKNEQKEITSPCS